ncbi:hypothetical protein O3G_MSEX010037 [Manduca sexta]|uniref:Uncharacterized protein n=1 Tax=Manduca sexta TaxID=7130 RepID=A0A921ZFD9_MANSE|nr:hypothetical protein O3G_MSEX010037 [Manduca sexta]
MESLKVCRVCLEADVKMYHLQTQPLGTYFENITDVNLLTTMALPLYACYKCATLMKKYYDFKERCLRGQTTLYQILNNCGKITVQELQKVDRKHLQLSSDITIQHLPEPIHCMHQDELIEPADIKKEPEEETELKISVELEEDTDNFPPPICSADVETVLLKSGEEEEIEKRKKIQEEVVSKLPPELKVQRLNHACMKEGAPNRIIDGQRAMPSKNTREKPEDEIDLDKCVTITKLSAEEQVEEIKKRQQSSNYMNSPFKCNLCYKGFLDAEAWKHHVEKHDPSAGELECPICKIRFKTKRTLKNHSANNHEKQYLCKTCSYVSKNVLQAKRHQRWHDGVTYTCPYCEDVFIKWTSYLSHVRIKHPSEFICGVCGYSFVSQMGLNSHKRLMHKDATEKPEGEVEPEAGAYCEECDVKFVSEEAWKRHMVTSAKHTKINDFSGCRLCGETFESASQLRAHSRTKHARQRPKGYGKKPTENNWPANCPHCSEELPNGREFWLHFRRVHPDEEYPIPRNHVCNICGKGFKNNAILRHHKLTHSEEKRYKCSTCGKAFRHPANLTLHETQTHSDRRPYPCTICQKAFKDKSGLNRHARSHTGLKPYTCEVCGKTFSQSNSCKVHMRHVHHHPSPPVPWAPGSEQATSTTPATPATPATSARPAIPIPATPATSATNTRRSTRSR